MTLVDVGSTRLWVEETGAGRPLLVCHGGPGLHHGPYRSLEPLATGRRLVHWDHRGHGRSAPLPDGAVDIALWADDAVALADTLGIGRFQVLGHSFGGWVAQELVLRHPERVDALVLVATTPGQLGSDESPDDDQGPPPPPEVAAIFERTLATDADVVSLYEDLLPHLVHRAGVVVPHADHHLASADSAARVFDALGRWSSIDRLPTIACPTLVVVGPHDPVTSVPQSERIARRIPGAELVVLEDAGHFVWLDDPDGFFPLVERFLAT